MAWFYNLILMRFFKIGLVVTSHRFSGPSATMHRNFPFFLENSQIPKIQRFAKHQKGHFLMACFTRPILAIFAPAKRQFVSLCQNGNQAKGPLLPLLTPAIL